MRQVRRLFAGIDTKVVEAPDSRAYALLNDSERAVSPSVIESLQSYDDQPILWSKRQAVVEDLRAWGLVRGVSHTFQETLEL